MNCPKCGNKAQYDNHKERYNCGKCYHRYTTITRQYCPVCTAQINDADMLGLDGMSAFSSTWIQCLKNNHKPFMKRDLIIRESYN
jgi:hypothetical protein